MSGNIGRDEFVRLLTERFPEIAADIDESIRGLLTCEMGILGHWTQKAISDEDKPRVRALFAFVGDVFRRGSPELQNAVAVSWLERLGFGGRHAKRINARGMLSPQLQTELDALNRYWEEMPRSQPPKPAAKPKKRRRA